jgi:hypothetical protein
MAYMVITTNDIALACKETSKIVVSVDMLANTVRYLKNSNRFNCIIRPDKRSDFINPC